LFLAGTDPYDDDESGTPSMGSTILMNSLTKRIVAEYTADLRVLKSIIEELICY
jgi:hypothetical protein